MNHPMHFLIYALLLYGMSPFQVLAQTCNTTASNLSFGVIPGNPTPQTDSTASINISCTGTVGQTVRACIGITEGEVGSSTLSNRLMATSDGLKNIQYQIYKNAGRSQIWGLRSQAETPLAVDIPIVSTGANVGAATMYGRVFSGQTKSNAVYFANFTTGTYRGFNRYGYVVSPTNPQCDTAAGTVVDRFTFQAGVEVNGTCTISTTDISFGTVLDLAVAVNATGTLTATCTLDLPFTVALNGGSTGDINNRKMTRPLGAPTNPPTLPPKISYQLYKNSGQTLIWGNTNTTWLTATGTGAPQTATVYGNVPVQANRPVGNYIDTITVNVTY